MTISRISLKFGFMPLIWFIFWLTLAGLFANNYNPLAEHGSVLSLKLGLSHTLFQIAGIGTGIGFCIFSFGLWKLTHKPISFGAMCWFVFGLSMISNGIWKMGDPMHGIYGIGMFALIAPALSAFELPKAQDDKWLYATTIICSVCGIIYLWLNLTGNDPIGYQGLTQRVFSTVNSLWPFVAALRLLKNDSVS